MTVSNIINRVKINFKKSWEKNPQPLAAGWSISRERSSVFSPSNSQWPFKHFKMWRKKKSKNSFEVYEIRSTDMCSTQFLCWTFYLVNSEIKHKNGMPKLFISLCILLISRICITHLWVEYQNKHQRCTQSGTIQGMDGEKKIKHPEKQERKFHNARKQMNEHSEVS